MLGTSGSPWKGLFDWRAGHWIYLFTTTPIESSFAAVRRTVVTPHLAALLRTGATFMNDQLMDRPGERAQPALPATA